VPTPGKVWVTPCTSLCTEVLHPRRLATRRNRFATLSKNVLSVVSFTFRRGKPSMSSIVRLNEFP